LLFHFGFLAHGRSVRRRKYWTRIGFELRDFRRGRPPLVGRQLIDEPIRELSPDSIDTRLMRVS
jgi:hypothetical protein